MAGSALRTVVVIAGVAAIAAGFWWALKPRPVAVDLATVTRGPLAVSIAEDGETRVRDIYRISAPVAGNVDRTLLEVGDAVKAGETVVATINPLSPAFIDDRTRAEARARVESARAAISVATAQKESAAAALDLARSDYDRARQLAGARTISQSALEQARIDVELKRAAVSSAEAAIKLRESELASARAALIQPGDLTLKEPGEECCVRVKAPIDGVVLSLAVKSEQVVAAGAELAEIGNLSNLEVVVDLLSSDAADVRPGMPSLVTGWGGKPVEAVVRRVDPAGFTKVSALGIEEKRVNTWLDLRQKEPALGHDFRVRVSITVWSADDALRVPVAALFRTGSDWTVFVDKGGRAALRKVSIGHMNADEAEVMDGLREADTVVVYPGEGVRDGVEIEARPVTGS